MKSSKNTLLLGTRKGLVTYKRRNGAWHFYNESFPGIPVNYAAADPRDGTWWACLDHGHWGCKLHFSKDEGANWTEVPAPIYPRGTAIKPGKQASLKYMWVLQPGAASEPERLYVGTDPGGLFISDNAGQSFALNMPLWNHPTRMDSWFGGGRDNPGIHSVVVDPDDPKHFFVAISVAGVFETKDGGETWAIRNKGLKAEYLPNPDAEVGQDPHILVAHPDDINYLWQQNHCGIFRSTDGGLSWRDISETEGPAKFGFAIAVDEKDKETAWVVPAISDVMRVTIGRALCVCRTTDGGTTWERLSKGLPQAACYDIVYRHALDITGDTLGFGTTTGNVFFSDDRGDSWTPLNNYLPMVYSVRFCEG